MSMGCRWSVQAVYRRNFLGYRKMHDTMNGKHLLRGRFLPLLFAAMMTVGLGVMPAEPLRAEPHMRTIETPLESTSVLSMRVNRAGVGRIELLCPRCEKGKVRLRVTRESALTLNGARVPLGQYSPQSRDFISGFFRQDDGVLTRLIVER